MSIFCLPHALLLLSLLLQLLQVTITGCCDRSKAAFSDSPSSFEFRTRNQIIVSVIFPSSTFACTLCICQHQHSQRQHLRLDSLRLQFINRSSSTRFVARHHQTRTKITTYSTFYLSYYQLSPCKSAIHIRFSS